MRLGIDLLSEPKSAGGIHTYVTELLAALTELRDEGALGSRLQIAVFAHRDYELDDDGASAGLEVHRTRWRGLPAPARRVLEHALLPRLVRAHRIDVVHCVNNTLPARLAAPGVVTVHDLSPFALPGRFGALKRTYLARTVPASVRRAARTICVSRATREQLLWWVPGAEPSRIAVVPHGVSSRFHAARSSADEERLRRVHALPEEFLLHVSRTEPGKNLAAVSRALARLRGRGVETPLVVVGHPTPYLRELRRLWRDLGVAAQVRYLGPLPGGDLPHLYRMARAFLFPSLHEGFGLPVLESFACGTPVVASTRSSLPEVAGSAALLVRPDDDEGLAQAVETLWRREELRELLRNRGLEQARRFSWRAAALRTWEVYRAALAAGTERTRAEGPLLKRPSDPRVSRPAELATAATGRGSPPDSPARTLARRLTG